MTWQDSAACIGADAEVFFPEVHPGAARPKSKAWAPAKAICARCPVRDECLAMAMREDIADGLWGGLTPKERDRIRRASGPVLSQILERWTA